MQQIRLQDYENAKAVGIHVILLLAFTCTEIYDAGYSALIQWMGVVVTETLAH
jgi:hypothetical protein